MANFVIGDVQGCFDSLQTLLRKLQFSPSRDTLWLAGDLVNRGPRSLDTLRYLRDLGTSAQAVLGNHDLHLLALWTGHGRQHRSDTIAEVVQAKDAVELIDWLRSQPLVQPLRVSQTGTKRLMVHAGLLPQWTFDEAIQLSNEVQTALLAADWKSFMACLYGNNPDSWCDSLSGFDRLRLIVNVCTRMRMLRPDASVDFKFKLEPENAPEGLKPWFELPRQKEGGQIFFGHWSTLNRLQNKAGFCLDTGCVWGGQLTAYCLETSDFVQIDAAESPAPSVP